MIFAIFKTYKDVKNGVKDPMGFGEGMLLESVRAPLILFTIVGGAILILFFLVGFTSVLIGPFGFFRFLLFFFLVPFVFAQFIFWKMYAGLKRLTKTLRKTTQSSLDDPNVIDVEVR